MGTAEVLLLGQTYRLAALESSKCSLVWSFLRMEFRGFLINLVLDRFVCWCKRVHYVTNNPKPPWSKARLPVPSAACHQWQAKSRPAGVGGGKENMALTLELIPVIGMARWACCGDGKSKQW